MTNSNCDDGRVDEPVVSNTLVYLSGYQLYLVVLAVSLAGFLYSLDITIITTAIPVITTHFHSIKDIGWYGSAYLITLCACTPLMGKIYQFYHSKTTFFTFVFIFEIGSLVCGVAPSSTAFIIGRAVAGIGGAGLFSGGLTIVSTTSTKEQRPKILALVYAFSMLGTVVGPILGGAITQKASWRWCFYINLPAGGVALAAISLIRISDIRDKSNTDATLYETINRLDPIGFCLFAPTCIMLLLSLQWGGSTYAWHSSTIIGLFIGSAVSLIAFCMWESQRGDSAMVPPSILSQRVVYSSCIVNISQYASLQIFAYYLPVWFQTVLGVSPIMSGVYFMATAVPLITALMLTATIASKMGNPAVYALIGNALAAIGTGLMSMFTPFSRTGMWVGYQILSGVGRGITLQQPIIAVQQNLESSKISVGTAMVVFCQFFSGALFLALAETDLSSTLKLALVQYAPGVNATLVFDAGATGVREAVTSDQLPGMLVAYNRAIRNTFYIGAAASAFAVLASAGMGFKNTRTLKHGTAAAPAKTAEPTAEV
ncbi:hypothetical protein OIDMADRAFT_45984 [Oidiodendron maius Zn]|uniref:Major facilitator superfamily (MFS) profile domain-containing protein n=1 Tax=Oidiodendron maius (strain Zn) TaxID=913774 RepID=A0A0C3GR80_OIDMZ|nr:hypothetical protein OIDMADRAFT_45984 [Oidiodendron maius Zn]